MKKIFIMTIAIGLFLAGCGSGPEALQPALPLENQESSNNLSSVAVPTNTAVGISSTDVPADLTDPVVILTTEANLIEPTQADTQTVLPALGFAMGDPNLRATDPSMVSLASGDVQLIEFFAFW